MKEKKYNSGTIFTDASSPLIYRIIDRSQFLSSMVRKGGISFKFAAVISMTLLTIIAIFVILFTLLSSRTLMSAYDKLYLTVAGNISATEAILTAEPDPLKRSLILQDIVSGLVNSKIDGLEYAAVYDLTGKIAGTAASYAAHTDPLKRSQAVPARLFNEIKTVDTFQKKKILFAEKNRPPVNCFQYRVPFKFFNVKVGLIEIVFTEESVLGPINKAIIIIIAVSIVLMLLGIGLAVFVARGMVRPIHGLCDGMISVREGDLETRLDINRHDEIGDLSGEFNTMIAHLREKLHMQKFVSKSTVSMIRKKSDSGIINLGGTRQNYAYLFSDIRGFTAMSEKMAPEEVVKILNEYLDLQAKIVKRNHGDIDKFVGDEVMAVFSGPSRADNAIMCAIEIIGEIRKLNKKREKERKKTIAIGIGLNIGDVIEGCIGSSDRMDNTSIGDTVNLAARLCSQADPGMILATKTIVSKSTKGKFTGKKLDPVKVKGKEKPIDVYSITGIK